MSDMRRAGYILAGGNSSRMGRNKALLPYGESTLIEFLASQVRAAAESVTLVGRPEAYRTIDLPTIADLRPGHGPLSGLETLLAHSRAEANLVMPCDVLGVEAALLARLLSVSEQNGAAVTVLRDQRGQIHPLCGVYRRCCLAAVQDALDHGQFAVMKLIQQFNPVYVEAGGDFTNLNTPEEWRAASLSPLQP